MGRPSISVLIDTYNHERFIEDAVVSVLEQDFPRKDREIIVVDDGSTDRTPDLLHKFERQVRVIPKPNGGQGSAFNVGIPECQGEIIAFLDGDDWWAKGKLSRVVSALINDPECGVVGHGIVNAFEGKTQIVDALEHNQRIRINSSSSARVFRLRKSYLGTSRMTLRKEIAMKTLPVPEALVIEADEYLFTLASCLSYAVILPDVLTYYRQHGENLYNAAGGNVRGLRRKQAVLEDLGKALRSELPMRGVPNDAVECICEIIEVEARQLRLMLEGGNPWDTVRTEKAIYRIMHSDARVSHRMFRNITMIVAGLLPPRWFYALRRYIAGQRLYKRIRKALVPAPGITRVAEAKE
jgi:glycosyltransferase involved in cell wall biosynthesis